jgi:quinol monooxygenase YgiN
VIVVEGTIRVADVERARPHMTAMIEASRAEAGCLDYAYAVDLLDPQLVRVSERWASREALAAHLKSRHISAWRIAWASIGISDRDLRLYEAVPEAF